MLKKNLTKPRRPEYTAQVLLQGGESLRVSSQSTWFQVPHLPLSSQGFWGTPLKLPSAPI